MYDGGLNLNRTVITIRVNGDHDRTRGKKMVMSIDWTFPQFLNRAKELMGMGDASRAFTELGIEIYDCMMIEENSLLFLSDGGPFIPLVDDNDGDDDGAGVRGDGKKNTLPAFVGSFAVHEELGIGAFGRVMRGSRNRGQVALKFISRKFIQQNLKTADMLNCEIKCLASLKHTNILQLHERLETAEHIVLAVDLMVGGDVLQHMKGRGMLAAEVALDDEAARHMFKQVLDGVTYMHQHNVVHRDLKLDNLLLCGTAAQLVKISDFGLAQILTSPTAKVRDLNGTLEYMAPEMFHDATFMGQPLDLWALGNILFALVCGRLPFAGVPSLSTPAESWPSESVIERNIRDQVYVYESFACRGARAMCDILLSRDPSNRYLAHHPWLSGEEGFGDDADDAAASATSASATSAPAAGSAVSTASAGRGGADGTSAAHGDGNGGDSGDGAARHGRSPMDRYIEAAVNKVTSLVRGVGMPFVSASTKEGSVNSGLDALTRSLHGRPDNGELLSKSLHGAPPPAGVAFGRGSRVRAASKPPNELAEMMRDFQEAEARINQTLARGLATERDTTERSSRSAGGGSVRIRAGSVKDDLDRSRNGTRDPLSTSRHGARDPLSTSRHGARDPLSTSRHGKDQLSTSRHGDRSRAGSVEGLHDELDKSMHEHIRGGGTKSSTGSASDSMRRARTVELTDELDKSLHSTAPSSVPRAPSQASLGSSSNSSHASSRSSLTRVGLRSFNAGLAGLAQPPLGESVGSDYGNDDDSASPTTFGFRPATRGARTAADSSLRVSSRNT